jgi:hypothetical protein
VWVGPSAHYTPPEVPARDPEVALTRLEIEFEFEFEFEFEPMPFPYELSRGISREVRLFRESTPTRENDFRLRQNGRHFRNDFDPLTC